MTWPTGNGEPRYSARLGAALAKIARDFETKDRKQAEHPYVFHLLQVAVTVAEHGGDEDQVVAALLHDSLEDVEGESEADIAAAFGPRVARLVTALSDALGPQDKPPWRPRKEAYLAHLRAAPEEVKLVSAADKLHNARSIRRDLEDPAVGAAVWRRFKPSATETLWYYREVVAALRVVGEGEARTAKLGRLVTTLADEVHALHDLSGTAYSA
jgi:(p)ppGpp synthase/HD superfamily hydrolase